MPRRFPLSCLHKMELEGWIESEWEPRKTIVSQVLPADGPGRKQLKLETNVDIHRRRHFAILMEA